MRGKSAYRILVRLQPNFCMQNSAQMSAEIQRRCLWNSAWRALRGKRPTSLSMQRMSTLLLQNSAPSRVYLIMRSFPLNLCIAGTLKNAARSTCCDLLELQATDFGRNHARLISQRCQQSACIIWRFCLKFWMHNSAVGSDKMLHASFWNILRFSPEAV